MLHVKRSLYLSRLSPIITAAFYAYNMVDEYAKDSSPIKVRKYTRSFITIYYANLTMIDRT